MTVRTTVTLILRLLIDQNEPGTLRGILCDVSSGADHTFTGEYSLVALLRAIAHSTDEAGASEAVAQPAAIDKSQVTIQPPPPPIEIGG